MKSNASSKKTQYLNDSIQIDLNNIIELQFLITYISKFDKEVIITAQTDEKSSLMNIKIKNLSLDKINQINTFIKLLN